MSIARTPDIRPGDGSAAVTPSDANDLAAVARALYVTAAGDVAFIGVDGATDTWTVPANFYIHVRIRRVKNTGTTATGIHAIW